MNKNIEAVIFDWAGTTVDYGCFAPVKAFAEVFRQAGIEPTMDEVREPMGMLKRDHIKTMLEMPRIRGLWEKKYGKSPSEPDIDQLYASFEDKLLGILDEFADPKPYVLEVTARLRELGIKTLFVSNASGGTNPDFEIGDLMIITDHINYFPEHPLRGKNIPYGPRFPDMSEAYDKELIRKANAIAAEKGIKVQHGVYVGTQGPTFETPAEYKLFHIFGADAVGMSTVPEVIVANHCGIKVFGISVITDLGVEGKIVEVTHEEVQKAADAAQPKMTEIMRELINRA